MQISRLTPARFEAFAMCARAFPGYSISAECSYWSTSDERLIGVVLVDLIDRDFNFVVLARDKRCRYRAVNVGTSFSNRAAAERALSRCLIEMHNSGPTIFAQGDENGHAMDFFTPQAPSDQLHRNFNILTDGPAFSAAQELISEMANVFEDPDGNFIRDFQTTGFNSRVWELYLFAALVEVGFNLDRSHPQPDFIVSSHGQEIAIEATTVNASLNQDGTAIDPPIPQTPNEIAEYTRNYMPVKFGSSLYSKMSKKDWLRDHVSGLPYVVAIADFHGELSMTWSSSALTYYLFGLEVDHDQVRSGNLVSPYTRINEHVWGDKRIPGYFFGQEHTEHVSAILFSNAGTLSKFNRMGVLAGFGDTNVRLVRTGTAFDPSPEAVTPRTFQVNVRDPDYKERWADELQVFHNPNAIHPLDPELIPQATHHYLEDGAVISHIADNKIMSSITSIIVPV